MTAHGERWPRTQQLTSAVPPSLFPARNSAALSRGGSSQPVYRGHNDTIFQLRAVTSALRAPKPTLEPRLVTPSVSPPSILSDVQPPFFTQPDDEDHPPHAMDTGDACATTSGLNRRWSCEICRKRKLKCNGNRPSCSFCSRRNFDCVYLGTKTRSEHDTQVKYRAELERRKKRRTRMLAKRAVVLEWAPESDVLNPASVISEPTDSTFALRPGADEGEELILIDAFFNIRPPIAGVLHKRTYLRSYKSAPAYLRLAVCAAGANIPLNSALSEKDSLWYTRQVVPMLAAAVRQPRLECVQALIILSLTTSYVGESNAALAHAERAARLALTLGLNIDPDYNGTLSNLSWLEKESRRRCFWFSFIGDQVRQAVTSCEPILSMSTSSVKPVGPESVWTSLRLPDSLEEEFESRRSVDENAIHSMVQLLEILHRIQRISRSVEHDDIEDDSSLRLTEEMLEADLSRWYNTIPASFWRKSEELLSAKKEDEGYRWQTCTALALVYHGCMCLLTRRRSMRCIRSLLSGVPAAASMPEEDLLAFKNGLDAAKAMARMISLFDCHGTRIGLLPHISMLLCLHSAMLLIVVEWLKSRKSPVGLAGRSVLANLLSPGVDDDPAAEENEKFANPSIMIDYFISVGTKVDRMRTTSNYLWSIVSKFRAGDWEFLDELDQDSVSSVAYFREGGEQSPSVLADTEALGDSYSFLEPATDFSSLSTSNATSSLHARSSNLSAGVHSPPTSVPSAFRTHIRELIKPLLEVRRALGQQSLLGSNPAPAAVDVSSTLRRRMQMPSGAASWPPPSALAAVDRYRTTRPRSDLFGFQGSGGFTFSGADGQDNDQQQAGWVGDRGKGLVGGELLAAAADSILFGKDGSGSGGPRFLFKGDGCYEEGDADILLDWLSSSRSTVR